MREKEIERQIDQMNNKIKTHRKTIIQNQDDNMKQEIAKNNQRK